MSIFQRLTAFVAEPNQLENRLYLANVTMPLCALRFIETFDDTISLQPGEPIDPKDPVELIDLVLETYAEQTIGLFDLFHAAQILVAHPHTGMAFNLFRYARFSRESL